MEQEDFFRGYGVQVNLIENPDIISSNQKDFVKDSFLKIRETLTRIGIASRKEKTLFQSCHILHKRGKYAILHFKELFALDGKQHNYSTEDNLRRNKIVSLLEEWELLKVIDPNQIKDRAPLNHIKIIHFSEKKDWRLEPKYQIGIKKKS